MENKLGLITKLLVGAGLVGAIGGMVLAVKQRNPDETQVKSVYENTDPESIQKAKEWRAEQAKKFGIKYE